MDFKIDGKTFTKMNENQWIQRLNDYGIQEDIAQKYYKIIVNYIFYSIFNSIYNVSIHFGV